MRGRFLTPAAPPGCIVSQSTFTSDSQAVAFVTICRLSGGVFRSSLSVIPVTGGPARMVASVNDLVPDAIRIAPVYRCLGCGYNPGT